VFFFTLPPLGRPAFG